MSYLCTVDPPRHRARPAEPVRRVDQVACLVFCGGLCLAILVGVVACYLGNGILAVWRWGC